MSRIHNFRKPHCKHHTCRRRSRNNQRNPRKPHRSQHTNNRIRSMLRSILRKVHLRNRSSICSSHSKIRDIQDRSRMCCIPTRLTAYSPSKACSYRKRSRHRYRSYNARIPRNTLLLPYRSSSSLGMRRTRHRILHSRCSAHKRESPYNHYISRIPRSQCYKANIRRNWGKADRARRSYNHPSPSCTPPIPEEHRVQKRALPLQKYSIPIKSFSS